VQVGTQSFVDPASAERIIREMEEYCRAQGVTDVRELVGGLAINNSCGRHWGRSRDMNAARRLTHLLGDLA